ncbi:hypothetical protein ACFWP3_22240 [Streptomyces sp. NPDC058525]|uniref:hypothetical protein n=1 Tax=Streptomyces sp. NPDC058525 TaxID=3346538 RepID=UPI00365C8F1F
MAERVSRWQWGWAVAAAVAGALVTVTMLYKLEQGRWMYAASASSFFLTGLVVALPLVMRAAPKAFARCCLIVGLPLVGWSVVGAITGMFVFMPAALLLLIAAFADPRNRPCA